MGVNPFSSFKARRVTRSFMSDEGIAFSDFFEFVVILTQKNEMMPSKKIPVKRLTDSNYLVHFLPKISLTSEKRMMLHVAAA